METALSLPRLIVAGWRRARLSCRARWHRVGPPRIRRLILMLQNECALRCRMCDLWLEPKTRFPREKILPLLSSGVLNPRASVHLTGGEPFLYADFASLYAEIRTACPENLMSISSSGVPSQAVIDFLRRGPDLERTSLVFSFDGVGAHDAQRGRPGTELELLSLLTTIRRMSPRARITLNCTITPWNAGAVRATFQKSRELGVGMHFNLAADLPEYTNPRRRPADGEEAFPFTEQARRRLRDDLCFVFNGLSFRRDRQEMGHLLRLIEDLRDGLALRPASSCPVPSQSAFIRCDGALLTCRGCAPVGNVLHEDLETAWNSAAARRLRREGCGRCERHYDEF